MPHFVRLYMAQRFWKVREPDIIEDRSQFTENGRPKIVLDNLGKA